MSKTDQVVSGDHLELRQYSYDQITPIRNSDEFVIQKDKCVEVTNLPVQKYVFSQKDWKGNVEERIVYAAFDNELLELIQCERSKFQNLNDELICKVIQIEDLKRSVKFFETETLRLEDEALQLKWKVCKIEQVGFWKRLVYLFKGKV